tara:strand:+ start:327 stop:560 length:234 start_codon:yes stop_codon:yes gene_type:complete
MGKFAINYFNREFSMGIVKKLVEEDHSLEECNADIHQDCIEGLAKIMFDLSSDQFSALCYKTGIDKLEVIKFKNRGK